MAKKSQKKIIFDLLVNRGIEGIHSFEFNDSQGEYHIPRVAAVIHELNKNTCHISSTREKIGNNPHGRRYILLPF